MWFYGDCVLSYRNQGRFFHTPISMRFGLGCHKGNFNLGWAGPPGLQIGRGSSGGSVFGLYQTGHVHVCVLVSIHGLLCCFTSHVDITGVLCGRDPRCERHLFHKVCLFLWWHSVVVLCVSQTCVVSCDFLIFLNSDQKFSSLVSQTTDTLKTTTTKKKKKTVSAFGGGLKQRLSHRRGFASCGVNTEAP